MTTKELIKENEELKEFRRKIYDFKKYVMFPAFSNPFQYPPGRDSSKHPFSKGGLELKVLENILSGEKPYQDTQREDVLKRDLEEVNRDIDSTLPNTKRKENLTANIKFRDETLKKLDALDFDVLNKER